MKATPTYLLESLSSNDVTFFIPPYQRNYEWSTDTCKVLLDDVLKVASANAAGEKTEHFFGSIVYVVEASGFGVPAKFILTDGQQRITTTMLLLMALRDSIQDELYRKTIQDQYVKNERAADDTEFKIKLKQVESDWEAYRSLALDLDVEPSYRNSAVYRNYLFFRKEIDPRDDEEKKALLEKGLMKFSTISIQLEPDRNPWENPQEIFESMNSLGQPLSLADLVRNYLLMGKNSKEQTGLYNDYWLVLERRLPGRLSEFVRDWMQADRHRSYKVASERNYKELYVAFKELVRDRPVENLFSELVGFSRPYMIARGLEGTDINELDQVISDLDVIDASSAYSYLAELISLWGTGGLSNAALIDVLSASRTYLLRRRLFGLTAGENKFFPTLGAHLDELQDSAQPGEALFTRLSSAEYALRVPNDDEVRSHLRTINFYNLGKGRNYPRLLLSMIEGHLTKSRPVWNDSKLQLEHIMPQSLTKSWRDELGDSSEETHQELVNNIGNLTLIRHNQELGNKTFKEKLETYRGNSGLQISQNRILDRVRWNRESIETRRDYIIDLILDDVLGLPVAFKRASNWAQTRNREVQFDSKVVLNQLIGETIEFVQNPKVTAKVVSDSKVLFEGKAWSLSPLTREVKMREGSVSDSSAFQGSLYWSWEGTRLIDLDL